MARILFLTQVLPYPLDAGPKTRAYYVLRYLAEAGHEVTLLSFVRDTDVSASIKHLRSFLVDVRTVPMRRSGRQDALHLLRSLPSRTPFLIARDRVPEMAQAVSELARHDFDFVHADQLWMAPYALDGRREAEMANGEWANGRMGEWRMADSGRQMADRRPRLVLDQHNAVFQIPRRLAQNEGNLVKRALLDLEARKMARYEVAICRQFDHVVWVTEEDYDAVAAHSALLPDNPADFTIHHSILPICIDAYQEPVVVRQPAAPRVTFLGGLHWPPNAEGILWFARHAWPAVHAQVPDAVLTIIGRDPPAQLAEVGGREVPESSGVERSERSGHDAESRAEIANLEVTGYVEDVRPYLTETAAFVVPLHAGGGMRVKILDAWRWGLPVVSTTVGAEGLVVEDEHNLLLADTPEAFAAAVVRVLQDRALADCLAANGRRTVEQHYHWRTVYRAWDDVYGTK